MVLVKSCATCATNFNGICAGHGSLYPYGDKITDINACCEAWDANYECFMDITMNAPRFLREAFHDHAIDYATFLRSLEKYQAHERVPMNIFDAVKIVYGISLVDIAVLMDVSFGVVYRAKSIGIPKKRIDQFSRTLCIPPELLISCSTSDLSLLEECRTGFIQHRNIESKLSSMPIWQKELSEIIATVYFNCPLPIAQLIARVDKLYWTLLMPRAGFTESELKMIDYLTNHQEKRQKLVEIDYSLDIACQPHVHLSIHR